ncbi:unnamed protein product [Parnassius mnemosyne]|uniref:Peptidase aspartic putative domain-containing protein n=1 Tax=Parnassius mnemosyne TaxID=213953 RepID=A0AAV1L9F8_9NEOP
MLSCLVLNELTARLPNTPVDIKSVKLPKNIQLADPMFYQPAAIDVLIGAGLFCDILGNEQRSLGPNNPKLRSSQLGWIISGPINSAVSSNRIHCNHAIVSSSQNENIEQLVSKFWELEEVPKKSIISEDESECERHFLANTIRDEEGRFCVKLPLKESVDCLGDITRQKTFVANRISEILEHASPLSWRYVPTDLNPADFISREVNAKNIMSLSLWWSGPTFLLENEIKWPVLNAKESDPLPELKVHSVIISEPFLDFERYSSLNKLQRLFSYVQRFIFNTKIAMRNAQVY